MSEIATPVPLETWENIAKSSHILKKYTSRGNGDMADEMIHGNKTFHVTTQERKINQEMAASPQDDPFANGRFSPVRLVDTADDLAEIAANPNLMGESDMVALVKGSLKALKERLAQVENQVVVERLLEVAASQDVTMGKDAAIRERLAELSPEINEVQTRSNER